MDYQKYRGTQLFTGYELLGNDYVLVVSPNGAVKDVVALNEAGENILELEGILTPGLVNCHCHTELSHLKNSIPPGTGLVDFLCSVVTKRNFPAEQVLQAMKEAVDEMYAAGIVAVGDICNTTDGISIKKNSPMLWHNFIEVLGLRDERAIENMARFKKVQEAYQEVFTSEGSTTLSPHAPYSISPATFELINAETSRQVISIHNQENPGENELYQLGTGDFLRLFSLLELDKSRLPVTGKSSLQSYLPYFTNRQQILLVHNTYSGEADIQFANDFARSRQLELFYCLCPGANLYIENRLPPVGALIGQDCRIVLGTDSYSSNTRLSIVAEIKIIRDNFPELPLETILQWATLNGAEALQMDKELGSFTRGKRPGVCLLSTDLRDSVKIF